ncbi:MAG TPA: hypothetical protein VH413_13690 [Verrucomicrobiae bacterium]|jgi:hypothetical protein|nr:hypothetical protein [Verrucomicrobiae bacterium]
MKLCLPAIIGVLSISVIARGNAQGTFIDLDFEHPVTPLNPVNSLVPIADALPGWTGESGTFNGNEVVYNTVSLGAAAISLQGPGSSEPILQGSYSVGLQGSSASAPESASIGQSGQIPSDVKSIIFFADSFSSFQVSFAGQPISLFKLGSTANYDVVAGDVSTFAGDTGLLAFTALPNNAGILDDIQFSPNLVPEPNIWSLILCGTAFFGVRRLKKGLA